MTNTSRRMFNFRLPRALNQTAVVSAVLAALLAGPVFADDTADVTKLVRVGQYAEALTKVDAFLVKNPRDAQMRFLKGVILTEQNKTNEAIGIFTKLTEDFPTLPEPYNNLAVLYAAAGQYDKARAALDMAIRTNPTYATAYENLGDIHAKLASQAYDKALQLDSGNSVAKSKLTLVRTLVGNTTGGTNPKIATTASVSSQPANAPSAPATKSAPTPPPAKTESPKAEAPSKSEPKASAADAEHEDVLNMVNSWARAWSSKDVKGYLGFYSSEFQTPGGQPRKTWEEERHTRIADKGRISVKIESPKISVQGNTATAKFRQIYVSDRLTSKSRKTLVLVKQGGKWQIKQEQTGS